MFRKLTLALPVLIALTFGFARPASAQWAVIDVASIAQAIQEYMTLEEQLTTVRDHLNQARQQYAALTGNRGMERLLSGTNRNYLPSSWNELASAMSGAGSASGGLSASADAFVTANSVLSPAVLARLSPTERMHLDATRRSVAIQQALADQALRATSSRFANLQQLIDAISGASDPKAVMDLQARIAAEQAMLVNESSKLQVLYQAAQAEQLAQRQRLREQAIADIGSVSALPPMGLNAAGAP
jgi:type IV secretion system protein VirB5